MHQLAWEQDHLEYGVKEKRAFLHHPTNTSQEFRQLLNTETWTQTCLNFDTTFPSSV